MIKTMKYKSISFQLNSIIICHHTPSAAECAFLTIQGVAHHVDSFVHARNYKRCVLIKASVLPHRLNPEANCV